MAYVINPSGPFHIAHADSESRPTATRSLALFKSTKIRFFRCIRVLFRPNNSTTQFTLTSHFFSSAPLREITSFICVLPTAPTYCDSFNSSHSWFEYSLIPTSEPFHIAHADSENRPTATRPLTHYICVICDIRGSFFLELASCADAHRLASKRCYPFYISPRRRVSA